MTVRSGDTVPIEALAGLVNRRMSEKAFQWRVIETAAKLGWVHYHTWNSQRSAPGFPDLVLVRERVIFAEIKAEKGTLSVMQKIWLEILEHAGQETHVWRPSDFETVYGVLRFTPDQIRNGLGGDDDDGDGE